VADPTPTEEIANEVPPTYPADSEPGPEPTSTDDGRSAPTTVTESTRTPQETATPILRHAQLSYPKKIEIGRDTVVRFAIFTERNQPLQQPGNETPSVPFTMPTRSDLRPRITVDLEVAGAIITKESLEKRSQDLASFNSWEWSIEATEKGDVTLRPHVSIEHVDAEGKALLLSDQVQAEPWETSHTIPADNVVSNATAAAMGDWFNANLLGLVGVVLGLPGTIISWRELFGKRRAAQAALPAG
jgi:hypothetical protein